MSRKHSVTDEGYEDQKLLQRASAGDEEAFTIIYRRSHRVVYRFALLMSGSESVAQDVTQEVFLVLMQQAERYVAARAALSTYLCGVARNLVMQRLRKDRRMDTLPEAEESLDEAMWSANALDPFAEYERGERIELLKKAVLALPPVYREAVVLCDLQEMRYADAAIAIGCTEGTVASRLHRGHALLWKTLRSMRTLADGERR
jgi:RNA polymerase sigma-70 factor, ECF subfamily